ncbi:COG4280 domain-containing protein [Acidithrix ferrooxidans]|uniref:Uncharacterized protein n=2 Tax=root TaxID=1 RepID=A0A0D8HFT9_9ACTN|nr:TMEM165/GDT1 family protein [Acidithrix ferrooxidans]KJF15906.1 hypothetical protein AXFE_32370 [Acidithrix ferrooxidans]
MSTYVLVAAVFLASCVEMVEALTIVLAAGTSRSWRSALEGSAAGIAVLTLLVVGIGPSLVKYVPIGSLRFIIGALLLIFGLQWLRKAILRSAGLKAMHNEDQIFEDEVKRLRSIPKSTSGRDSTAFAVAFKGVFLEGLEVVIVVLTLGLTNHKLLLASVSALAAVILVGIVGAIVSKQLSKVPENAMKMGVGLMLVSFGSFWSGEGMGVHWPASDASILLLLLAYSVATALMIRVLSWQYKGRLTSRGAV